MVDPNFRRGNYLGFRTKKALQNHISLNILNAHSLGANLEGEDLYLITAILERHPRAMEKIGSGVAGIRIGRGPYRDTRGFRIVRVDGEEIDFSYMKCLRPQRPETTTILAFRYAVREQTHALKLAAFMKAGGTTQELICPIRGERFSWSQAHVDHIPPDTFKNLVAKFMELRGMELADVRTAKDDFTGMLDVLEDETLAKDFADFHQKHARLRVVSAKANLSDIPIAARSLEGLDGV